MKVIQVIAFWWTKSEARARAYCERGLLLQLASKHLQADKVWHKITNHFHSAKFDFDPRISRQFLCKRSKFCCSWDVAIYKPWKDQEKQFYGVFTKPKHTFVEEKPRKNWRLFTRWLWKSQRKTSARPSSYKVVEIQHRKPNAKSMHRGLDL